MSCASVTVKRGGSLRLQHRVSFDGKPTDVTGWGISSSVCLGKQVVGEFTVNIIDAVKGELELVASSTEDWPIATLQFDVKYVMPATGSSTEPYVVYSPTVNLVVKERVTP